MCDGKLYQDINKGDVRYITYNYSTDGAPLTKSDKRSFWPLQIILNCLLPLLRFRYVLLAGMLLCTHEPNSNLAHLYFSKFIEQVQFLFNKGITVFDSCHEFINIKFCPLSCPVDSVCRPILQNRLQFNGFSGCSWCYDMGTYFKSVKGIRYTFQEYLELRSHESHMNDIKLAELRNKNNSSKKHKNDKDLKGVEDDICLTDIPHIDMVWSLCFEYMHGILSGVDTHIFRKWTANSTSEYYLHPAQKKII